MNSKFFFFSNNASLAPYLVLKVLHKKLPAGTQGGPKNQKNYTSKGLYFTGSAILFFLELIGIHKNRGPSGSHKFKDSHQQIDIVKQISHFILTFLYRLNKVINRALSILLEICLGCS